MDLPVYEACHECGREAMCEAGLCPECVRAAAAERADLPPLVHRFLIDPPVPASARPPAPHETGIL